MPAAQAVVGQAPEAVAGGAKDIATPAPSAAEPRLTVEDVLLLLAFLYHAFRGGK